MKVKIKEIANDLGLSVSTVSRALNDSPMISEATKDLVRQKAIEKGYFNKNLRIIQKFHNVLKKIIGICVSNINNPICVDVIRGVENYFSIREFGIIVMDSEESIVREEQNVRKLLELDVQGLIIFPVSSDTAKQLKSITEGIVPTVYVCNISEDKTIHSVGIDEEWAFGKLTEYLIQMGHEKIFFIGGSRKFVNRVRGYENSMKKNGCLMQVVYCAPTYQESYKAMARLIEEKQDFTAVVAASDFLALGVMDAIYDCEKTVPNDYSLVGFDNINIIASRRINLTTMNQPAQSMGEKAAEIVFHEITEGIYEYKHTEIFDTFLVIRESCRKYDKNSKEGNNE